MHDKWMRFFLRLSNNVRIYHWTTSSYARHKSSDVLFDDIVRVSDAFLESYFGKYGRPDMREKHFKFQVSKLTDREIVPYLKAVIDKIEISLSKTLQQGKDDDLKSIIDELIGKINQALYLFSSA